ncbi:MULTISPECIES: sensor domain-containing diguanylate cyclase [Vibrio]|uniref:sensor domain-containing diguanylate cyclase n=2 Tax=Vibrionaceae TaxID=641 RepID=UPI0002EC586D|nr:GGDEF domain-containing protein [Vibrio crassostreae]OEE87166.1 PAS domain S-box protein [Vibrio crassostreae 9ZC88]
MQSNFLSHFMSLLSITSDYIYFKDMNYRFILCSQNFAELVGKNSWRELHDKDDFDLFPHEHALMYRKEDEKIIEGRIQKTTSIEPYTDNEGNEGWVSTCKWPLYKDGGSELIGMFGISRDITEQVKLQKLLDLKEKELVEANIKLKELSEIDPLTGLYNRRIYSAYLKKISALAMRSGEPLSLLIIDIDNFKNYNDNYGHAAGDTTLKIISSQLRKNVYRDSDLLVRYGGEEFVAVLPNTNLRDAKHVAERIRKNIQAEAMTHEYSTDAGVVTVSIGISTIKGKVIDTDNLFLQADNSLYKAKTSGRNRCEAFCCGLANLVR